MNWIPHPTTLTGPRIKLVPLEVSHIPNLAVLATEKIIWELNPFNTDKGEIGRLKASLLNSINKQKMGEIYAFAIQLKESETIIGTTRFWKLNKENRGLEIGGTWIHPDYWGGGFNTECKYLMLTFCFEVLQTIRVQINAAKENIRSRKAIEKLGAKFEGIIRKDKIYLDGTHRMAAYYSIIDDEWEEVKDNLEKLLTL